MLVWGGEEGCEHAWGEEGLSGARNRQGAKGGLHEGRGVNKLADGIMLHPPTGQFCLRCGAWLGSLGLEPDPWLYVEHIVEVFREARRVLRDDGTLWLNMGDTYGTGTTAGRPATGTRGFGEKTMAAQNAVPRAGGMAKQLLGIPWRVALALQADGWWLRSDIIWAKPNCMPESVRDRPTKSHEYVFLLAKSKRYYYDQDAIREPHVDPADTHRRIRKDGEYKHSKSQRGWMEGSEERAGRAVSRGRNKRTVWAIPTHPFPKAHFATFAPKLVEPMIKVGTSERGACPECGKAWVRVVKRLTPSSWQARKAGGAGSIDWHVIGQQSKHGVGVSHDLDPPNIETIGWQPACSCGLPDGFQPDDFEPVETPTGERVGDDPTLLTGRAGYNRPRGPKEGKRAITRYEQRKYAEQLKNSPRRAEMAAQVGPAFEHYIRTDKSGARPIPPDLLGAWLEQGWLEQVEVPEWEPPDPIPCIILDPFAGAGTTSLVAEKLGRDSVLIDLSPEYAEMSKERILGELGSMFTTITTEM